MTDERAAEIFNALPAGFVDTSGQGLNTLNAERDFGELGRLMVTARHTDDISVWWDQGIEQSVEIRSSVDLEQALDAVRKAVAFLESLSRLTIKAKIDTSGCVMSEGTNE
jgi:hypothetical protein